MIKKIQKPFSIEEWENGAKVETRDGRSVRILCTDMKSQQYDIVGLAELDGAEVVMTWLANGHFLPEDESDDCDLVIVEEVEEPERWAEDKDCNMEQPKVLIMLDAEENVSLVINKASIADISALLLTVAHNRKDVARALRLAVLALNKLESN